MGYIDASLKKIRPLDQKIFHIQGYDLENEIKVTKISAACQKDILMQV